MAAHLLLILLSFSLTAYHAASSNLTLLTTPIPYLTPTSFSSHFSFSLSPHSSISFLLLHPPSHFSIDFNSDSISIGNTSCPNLIPDRQRLHAFVDYHAASSQLEVRFGVGKQKPYKPVLVFSVNFFRMWGEKEVLVALGSNTSDVGMHSIPVDPRAYELKKKVGSENANLGEGGGSVVYSWQFRSRSVAKGLHSKPVDPRGYVNNRYRSGECYLTVLSALMIATGCCVFVVFMVMFFKVLSTDWDEVLEMEYTMKPVKNGYEMVGADVENSKFGNVKG